ncbi:hypothetical protein BDB00DRAFT_873908 [Zychaea mexicana]|uniref:uncharacterized protein n=1 Tax=Zychaea mexicana TaxID=64656 RepID=UPI0022FE02C5|nr:uncharacterized protein BDB00DRAFT_873908 [Zychaea mexicana]KAI9491877.1 hypothetical protein BDB00DRAFT_873908 [Zychaea mexicana]
MDIACFIPLHFYQHQHHHHQDSGPLALSRTDWHSNKTDTCLLVSSPAPAYSCKSETKKRSLYQQQTPSSFELSRTKRQCQQQQQQDMQPRHRSSTTSRPTSTNRRRSSRQNQQQRQQDEQQQQYPSNQQQQTSSSSSTLSVIASPDVATVNSIEDDLHHLRDEWATIDIVLHSLRNVFTIQPLETATEEHLDDVDRELSIAYDDLKAQVRHLERSLHRLDAEISSFREPRTPMTTTSSSSATTTITAAAAPTTGGLATAATSRSTSPKKKRSASPSSTHNESRRPV